jgi:phytoene synthase
MRNINIYNLLSARFSKDITEAYSSSFSAAAGLLGTKEKEAIYAIYGFVRIADEIVDSWRPKDMKYYLDLLGMDIKKATKSGFSTNPIVHNFARTIREYNIPFELVDSFMRSMNMDITKRTYSAKDYKIYIYGSAEVVGLMCLMVFVGGNKRKYNDLMPAAKALGAAFQKINFLRDFAADSKHLGRMYFPGKDLKGFDEDDKLAVINDIKNDLATAKKAIKKLPKGSRYGVELAYKNFLNLTKLSESTPVGQLKKQRISLARSKKIRIYTWIRIKSSF